PADADRADLGQIRTDLAALSGDRVACRAARLLPEEDLPPRPRVALLEHAGHRGELVLHLRRVDLELLQQRLRERADLLGITLQHPPQRLRGHAREAGCGFESVEQLLANHDAARALEG